MPGDGGPRRPEPAATRRRAPHAAPRRPPVAPELARVDGGRIDPVRFTPTRPATARSPAPLPDVRAAAVVAGMLLF